MIFQSNCSYWTLLRPKYSWAWAGTDDTSAKTGAKSTAQRERSRVMNCPADEPQQKSRVERQAAGMLGPVVRRSRKGRAPHTWAGTLDGCAASLPRTPPGCCRTPEP